MIKRPTRNHHLDTPQTAVKQDEGYDSNNGVSCFPYSNNKPVFWTGEVRLGQVVSSYVFICFYCMIVYACYEINYRLLTPGRTAMLVRQMPADGTAGGWVQKATLRLYNVVIFSLRLFLPYTYIYIYRSDSGSVTLLVFRNVAV